MSHKSFDVDSYIAWNAAAQSGTATIYSGAPNPREGGVGNALGSDIKHSDDISWVFLLTGTANGTLTLEVSNASDDQVMLGTDVWVTYTQLTGNGFTAGVATVTSGQVNSSASFGVAVSPKYRRVRWKYVNATSSGTITAVTTIKAR